MFHENSPDSVTRTLVNTLYRVYLETDAFPWENFFTFLFTFPTVGHDRSSGFLKRGVVLQADLQYMKEQVIHISYFYLYLSEKAVIPERLRTWQNYLPGAQTKGCDRRNRVVYWGVTGFFTPVAIRAVF
jgi:hypothetical protein